MSVDLFERYRDALRRGHVAAARGRLEDAVAAYGEAIALAPDRPVAHTSLAAVHLRRGDPKSALAEADVALGRVPRDEAALASRVDALVGLGRRIEAAEALDRLSDIQSAAGRPADALATARRALALAEQKTRRRHLEALTARLAPIAADAETAAAQAAPLEDVGAGAGTRLAEPSAGDVDEAAPEARIVEPEPPVDGSPLLLAAEAAADAHDLEGARRNALAAAVAFARSGHVAAAIDACSVALTVAPDDPDLHLILVELYLDRGWRPRAAEKLTLLGRLIELDGRDDARARLCEIVGAEFPDHPELVRLCA